MNESASLNRITRSNSTSSEPEKKTTTEKADPKQQNNVEKICSMIQKLQQTVDSNQKSSNDRFYALENKLSLQNDSWKSELNNVLAQHLADSEKKYKEIVYKVSSIKDTVVNKFEDIDRQNRQCDILIRGVPMDKKENLFQLYDKIALILKFQYEKMYTVSAIFRLKYKVTTDDNQVRPPPILIKFSTPILKRMFFNLFIQYKSLKANDIGFKSTNRLYISDNLTKKNSTIYSKVGEMKSSKQIDKVQVRNGFIYVKYPNTEEFIKIDCLKNLPTATPSSSSSLNSSNNLNETVLQNE